ncbi:MAG: threonine--tRNA ligase [Chloroflexi bacterium OHK40]
MSSQSAPAQPYVQTRLYRIRHSAAHVLAQAVLELFPEAKLAIGPPIEDGFYYDFDLPRSLTPDDLAVIEARMRAIIAEGHPFVRRELSAAEARALFAGQPYKLELIEGLVAGTLDENGEPVGAAPLITTYRQDHFEDLCRGPHVASTDAINPDALRLLRVSGAYWRGDERNPMLQRVYGTAFETPEELEAYLARLAEARARDYRVLGRELDLFSFAPDVGPGLALWTARGGRLRELIEDHWARRHREGGYERVYTPHIGKRTLWETSGHLRWYRESMYAPIAIEEQEYYLKPMNCPFHIQIFKSQVRSYRDLPQRLAEPGTVYRFERSGTLNGLLRVRGFTQDDAHIFCTLEQMEAEVQGAFDFSLGMLRDFGLDSFHLELSTHDPARRAEYAGSDEDWALAEATLARVLERSGMSFQAVPGEAAFYGPKIDIKARDGLGRLWQLSTIQFDFWLPQAFDLEYVGADGERHRPYMVHRALLGSVERFVALLIEHYKGAFPAWLAPEQAVLVPVTDGEVAYAHEVATQLRASGARVLVDDGPERMANKIRRVEQTLKPPFILVVGKREVAAGTVAVRARGQGDQGAEPVGAFVARLQAAVTARE